MSLFNRASRTREPHVHISVGADGYRSVSIYGSDAAEVAELMHQALTRLDRSAVTVRAELD